MTKRKTHEQFAVQLGFLQPSLAILGTYQGTDTSIEFKCLKDGHVWKAKPNNLLQGKGCPKCAGVLKTTTEDLQESLNTLNKNITVLERVSYNGKLKFLVKCDIDGYEWVASKPQLLVRGCAKCSGNAKKSHDEFVSEVRTINPNIDVVGYYSGAKNKIRFRCRLDGHEWDAAPSNIIFGRGCPKCGGSLPLSDKDFVARVATISPMIKILSKYVKSSEKVEALCTIDGHVWKTTPNKLLFGRGCPKCAGNMKRTQEEFVEEIKTINPKVKITGEYCGRGNTVSAECLRCGNTWNPLADTLLSGGGCPDCAEHGYSRGKMAQFYVYTFGEYVGFGITNDHKTRHQRHRSKIRAANFEPTLMLTANFNGDLAWSLEKYLKKVLPIANSGVDGFKTECVLSGNLPLLFDEIKQFFHNTNLSS